VFLGGAFYSISMLPPVWQTVSLFNPVVYLISGFRWSFFGLADVAFRHRGFLVAAVAIFRRVLEAVPRTLVAWIFRTSKNGWRLRP
jgi:ABC-2 type transport system permease protein